MTIPEAHGREEITCIAFDVNYQRLISGSHEGSLKVWGSRCGRRRVYGGGGQVRVTIPQNAEIWPYFIDTIRLVYK